MKILFLISGDRVPSARFRVLPFVPRLREAGHRCTVASSVPQKYDYFPALGFRPSQWLKRSVRWWHLARAIFGRYDIVFIDRELFDDGTCRMEARFRKAAPAMVLDVDDAVFLRYPCKFERLARMSERVIAGNRLIAEHVITLNPNVVVIPTCVDLDEYQPKQNITPPRRPTVIGWMGTTSNLANLQLVAPALRRLAGDCDFEMRVIAPDDGPLRSVELSGVSVNFIPWNPDTEIEELRGFDVGLMPLSGEQDWNRYKCGLKLIQYMGVGIPGVASPVGVNAEIVTPGENGFLAEDPDEWEHALRRLIESPELRIRLGTAARHTVALRYSIAAQFPRFEQVLLEAAGGGAGRACPKR